MAPVDEAADEEDGRPTLGVEWDAFCVTPPFPDVGPCVRMIAGQDLAAASDQHKRRAI